MNWFTYVSQFVIMAVAVVWCVQILRNRLVPKSLPPSPSPIPRPSGTLLTPPPAPINRMEFLQARIAYLAHMRDIGIEITEEDESGNLKTHIRPAKPAEMIEAINLQNEDHVKALFDTWDQVQRKQREKSL
jgi:hypothetical protein